MSSSTILCFYLSLTIIFQLSIELQLAQRSPHRSYHRRDRIEVTNNYGRQTNYYTNAKEDRRDCGLAPHNDLLTWTNYSNSQYLPAKHGLFPWHVFLLDDDNKVVCHGSILSERYILTAAACKELRFTKAVIGQVTVPWPREYIYAQTIDIDGPQCIRGSSSVRCVMDSLEQTNTTFPSYDFGVVKLSKRINFMAHIGPICLAQDLSKFDPNQCYFSGIKRHRSKRPPMIDKLVDELYFTKMAPVERDKNHWFCSFEKKLGTICAKSPDGKLLINGPHMRDFGGAAVCWDKTKKRWFQYGILARGIGNFTNSNYCVTEKRFAQQDIALTNVVYHRDSIYQLQNELEMSTDCP